MVLIGMDVDDPEPDFVGFSIEEKIPGGSDFVPLKNRLNFSYGDRPASEAVDGFRNFPSTDAPFQKFRWIQFPANQAKSGAVREAIDRLEGKNRFSYRISDRAGGLEVTKPDGSRGIADFKFLADNAPEPLKSEWSGGEGVHESYSLIKQKQGAMENGCQKNNGDPAR